MRPGTIWVRFILTLDVPGRVCIVVGEIMAFIRRRDRETTSTGLRVNPGRAAAAMLGRDFRRGLSIRQAELRSFQRGLGFDVVYELAESVREGPKVRQRFLMSLGPFSSVAEIKRAIVSRRQLLSARACRGWYSRGRAKAKVPDDELVLDLEALLDRLARLLVVRPRSRRKLWPDADDWLRGR